MNLIVFIFIFNKAQEKIVEDWPQINKQKKPKHTQIETVQMVNVIDMRLLLCVIVTARARIYGHINLFCTFRISKLIKSNKILLFFIHTSHPAVAILCCDLFATVNIGQIGWHISWKLTSYLKRNIYYTSVACCCFFLQSS